MFSLAAIRKSRRHQSCRLDRPFNDRHLALVQFEVDNLPRSGNPNLAIVPSNSKLLYHRNLVLSRRGFQTGWCATPPVHPPVSLRSHSSFSNNRDGDRAPRHVCRDRRRDFSTTSMYTREPWIWRNRCRSYRNLIGRRDQYRTEERDGLENCGE